MQGAGRSPVTISYSHAYIDCSKIFCFSNYWIYQRKECYSYCADLSRTEEELQRDVFLGSGYFVSSVGADEEVVRVYIRAQEKEDHRVEQLSLFKDR